MGSLSYAVLLKLFPKAIYQEICSDDNYNKLPELEKPKRAFSLVQLHSILDLAEKRNLELYQVIRFAIATGIRQGQIYGFEWRQVNWDTNEITCPPKHPKSKIVVDTAHIRIRKNGSGGTGRGEAGPHSIHLLQPQNRGSLG